MELINHKYLTLPNIRHFTNNKVHGCTILASQTFVSNKMKVTFTSRYSGLHCTTVTIVYNIFFLVRLQRHNQISSSKTFYK